MKKTIAALAALAATGLFADLYMAGDSTMCNYQPRQYPQQGWGQALPELMKNPDKLHNWAIGGRSAKSFKNEGRWQTLVDALKPGDYVIVAFGHNDANKAKAERYSTPEEYKDLMRSFAADVKAKKATIVFATSIPHSGGFTENDGVMNVRGSAAGIGPYVDATRELGKELNVPVLDLNKYACDNLPKIGFAASNKLYMRIAPGEYENHPNGKSDGCHIRDTGAFFFAQGAVRLAKAQKLKIMELFKDPEKVVHTPIPFGGPGANATLMKDDFSKEEIAYANEEAANKEAKKNEKKPAGQDDWRSEIMALRREAEARGMSKDDANRWAAAEYRRRQGNSKTKTKRKK